MTDNVNIAPGDIVTLKSGGPAMTVSRFDTADAYECLWFDDMEQARSIIAHRCALQRVEQDQSRD